jgi:hypothetical protein
VTGARYRARPCRPWRAGAGGGRGP